MVILRLISIAMVRLSSPAAMTDFGETFDGFSDCSLFRIVWSCICCNDQCVVWFWCSNIAQIITHLMLCAVLLLLIYCWL